MLLLLLVTLPFANKHKNILWNPEWACQRELLFHVWAGRLPDSYLSSCSVVARLAFELGEAGRELNTAATDPKGLALSCSLHLGVL